VTEPISVVIPTYSRRQLLDVQLTALADQDFDGTWEVVVADNGSTDDSVALAESYGDRIPVRVIGVQQRGVNAARNAGVAATQHSRLAFLDDDDRAHPGWLRAINDALDQHRLVGGRLEYTGLNDPLVVAGRVQQPCRVDLPKYRGVPHAFGANMGCHRSIFDELHGFDPDFKAGGDDIDFCFRAHLLGVDTEFVNDALVSYRLRPTRREYRLQMQGYAAMDALVDAKQRRAGAIPPQTARSRAAAAWGHVKLLSAVDLWLTPVGRWHYAHRVGNATGAVQGFVRYHQLVL
jgi:glycosyltransferase involved in cell wall biosynthesis